MSEEAARDAVIRMATDPEFREGVRSNDPAAFAGLDLTPEEIAKLQALSAEDGGAGIEPLAARLSKSSLAGFFSSSLASLHGGDASHDAAGSYTPEQHDAASAPVPLTEHAVTFHDPAASYAPPGGGNHEAEGVGIGIAQQTGDGGHAETPIPITHDGGFTGGVLPSGAGDTHSLLNHPTDGGPAAQGGPVHHGDASYEKPDKPDGGPKPPKLDGLISDRVSPDAAHSGAHGDAGYQPDKPDGGPKPPKLDGLISDRVSPDAAHSGAHGDAGYQPDKPDGGPKPPKLDSFISDHATNPDAASQVDAEVNTAAVTEG